MATIKERKLKVAKENREEILKGIKEILASKNTRMNLKEARKQYLQGEISFQELDKIFFEKASNYQIKQFWLAPVWDRPKIIEGKNKPQRDKDWLKITSCS